VIIERFHPRQRIDRALFKLLKLLVDRLAISPLLSNTDSLVDFVWAIHPLIINSRNIGNGETNPQLLTALRSLLASGLPPDAQSLIPSLARRQSPVDSTWTYQNQLMQWDIQESDRVLDVGCGGWPFKHATHLADKYPETTTHRTERLARDHRPFYDVDIEKLPFSDKSFDFVFCSHVLEHTENPGIAMRELCRVGKRGYVEVPTRLSDVMFNFTRLKNHHKWHGLVVKDTVILIEWSDSERRDLGNEFFDELHSHYDNRFQDFFIRNRDLFFASLHWNADLNFLVIDKSGNVIDEKGAS
jgi:SAM-dependent methyltransferase